jgi:hypothetical protein
MMKYVKILADKKTTQTAKAIIAAQSEMAIHSVDQLHKGANFLLSLRENVRLGDAIRGCSVDTTNRDPEEVIAEVFYRISNVARAAVAIPEIKSAMARVFAADDPAAELADILFPKKQEIEVKLEEKLSRILSEKSEKVTSSTPKWYPASTTFSLQDVYEPDNWIWQQLLLKKLPVEWDQKFDFNDENSIRAELLSFRANQYKPTKYCFEAPLISSTPLFSSLKEDGYKRYFVDLRETSGAKYFLWARFDNGSPRFVLPLKRSI